MVAESITRWLLDSDPALRWQVERDLLGELSDVWEATLHDMRVLDWWDAA